MFASTKKHNPIFGTCVDDDDEDNPFEYSRFGPLENLTAESGGKVAQHPDLNYATHPSRTDDYSLFFALFFY